MKKILALLALLLSVNVAVAQDCGPRVCSAMAKAGNLLFSSTNNEATGLPIGTTGQVLVVDSTGIPQWSSSLAGAIFTQDIIYNDSSFFIYALSSDGADSSIITLLGGGASGSSRGGLISIAGNENAATGDITIRSGNVASSSVDLVAIQDGVQILNGSSNVMWTFGSTGFITQNATNGANILFNKNTSGIFAGTSDAADNLDLYFGGGGAGSFNRGGYIVAAGNEATGAGTVQLWGGNTATANVSLILGHASAKHQFFNASTALMWSIDNNGTYLSDATNGGGITLAKTGGNVTPILSGMAAQDADITNITGTHTGLAIAQTSEAAYYVANTAATVSSYLSFFKTRAAAPAMNADTIVASGDELGRIRFFGADGSAYRQGAVIIVTVDGTPGASDMPGAIDFQTTPDGSSAPASVLKLSNDKSSLFTGTVRSSATADLGWSVVNVANQACNTTCTSACVVGIDTLGTGGFLSCATATADSCLCAGAS